MWGQPAELKEDMLLLSMKRQQRESWTGRVRKLSWGIKKQTVSFTFLLTDSRKTGGKIPYKAKHLGVCVTSVCRLKGTGETCGGAASLSLKLSICNQC